MTTATGNRLITRAHGKMTRVANERAGQNRGREQK
jgi:hypothetical protein